MSSVEHGGRRHPSTCRPLADHTDPEVEALMHDIIGKVADRWTMLVIEALTGHDSLRFTRIARSVGSISQKMLTQTLRQMEQDGLVSRTVHPVVPPHVDYALTDVGRSLAAAFCGVWLWVETNHEAIKRARAIYAATPRSPARD